MGGTQAQARGPANRRAGGSTPPPLRTRKAPPPCGPRPGRQPRLRTPSSSPERKWRGRPSSASALLALHKMAKIAKTHEGKKSSGGRRGAFLLVRASEARFSLPLSRGRRRSGAGERPGGLPPRRPGPARNGGASRSPGPLPSRPAARPVPGEPARRRRAVVRGVPPEGSEQPGGSVVL